MVQTGKQQTDVLDSIFDFVFEESKKKPSPGKKPMKVTGVDGTSEIVDALAAIIEQPALFINETTMDAFSEFVDIDLVNLKLGDRGQGVKLSLKDVGSFVKDPSGFVDSAFKKMEGVRKMQRAAHAGEGMKAIMGAMWARSNNLDRDTQRAVTGMGRPDAFKGEQMARAQNLMEKEWGRLSQSQTTIDDSFRSVLERRYGSGGGAQLFKTYKEAEKLYRARDDARATGDRTRLQEIEGKILALSRDSRFYSSLEGMDIRRKASGRTGEERHHYMQAAKYVEHMGSESGGVYDKLARQRYMGEVKKSIERSKKRIKSLKKSGAPQSAIAEERKGIKQMQANIMNARGYEFAGRFGQMEGAYYSVKGMVTDGQLLPYLINGKFFDDRYNSLGWFQPTQQQSFTSSYKWGIDKETGARARTGVGVAFKAPKQSDNVFIQTYTNQMTELYYLSPATLIRSLATGEVFAYRAFKTEQKLIKILASDVIKNIPGFNEEDFLTALKGGKLEEYLGTVQNLMDAETFNQVKKIGSVLARQAKLAQVFSTPARFKQKIQDYLQEHIGKNIRDTVGRKIIEKLGLEALQSVGGKAALALVNTWIEKGGIVTLVKGVVTGVLEAIGVSTAGPVGVAIAYVVSEIVTKLIMKVAKPLLKLTGNLIQFVAIGLLCMVILAVSFFFMINGQHSHVSPGYCEECQAWDEYGEMYKFGDDQIDDVCGVTPVFTSNPTCCLKNTLDLPPSLIFSIEEAANAYNVPPSLVLAVIYGEGYLNPGSSFFDESFVAEHIKSCAQVPDCNPDGEMILFNIYKKWWDDEAVKVYDSNREAYPCNIFDMLFSVAKGLRNGRFGSSQFQNPLTNQPYTCFGITLNTGSTASVSCDDWSSSDVITAIRGWEFGTFYKPDTLSCATKQGSCLMGGGVNAQCPTGGDTCETISNRYSASSHMGCLWDVYQQNKGGECLSRPSVPASSTGRGGRNIDFRCESGESLKSFFKRIATDMGVSSAELGFISPGDSKYTAGSWWCIAASMDSVLCKSDKVNSCSNGIAKLFVHETVHLRQYRNASRKYGTLFMEWGADWISQDGGGYRFVTSEGKTIRASETPLLPSCTPEAYRGIAFNELQYLNSQCYARLRGYIKSFGTR